MRGLDIEGEIMEREFPPKDVPKGRLRCGEFLESGKKAKPNGNNLTVCVSFILIYIILLYI